MSETEKLKQELTTAQQEYQILSEAYDELKSKFEAAFS